MKPPRLKRLFHWDRFGKNLEESLDDEVKFHLETRIEQLIADGKSPEEAREEALKQFEAGIDKNARAILSLARITAALGRIDDAYAWLDRAFEERVVGLVLINVDPAYDPLRSDPRFDRFLNRMGLH